MEVMNYGLAPSLYVRIMYNEFGTLMPRATATWRYCARYAAQASPNSRRFSISSDRA